MDWLDCPARRRAIGPAGLGIWARDDQSDLRPGDSRRWPRPHLGTHADPASLHSISSDAARNRHNRRLFAVFLARALRRARLSLPSLPGADGAVPFTTLD